MSCHICNRPECDVEAARLAYKGLSGNPTSSDWPAIESRWNDALRNCHRNRIDWRARCLAAEAELAKLREGLPKWQVHSNGDAVLSSAKDNGGAMIGFVEPMLGYWRAFLDKECTLGRAVTPESARRLVEQHHGLPVCEVLP